MVSEKNTRSSYKGMMDGGTPSLFSDSAISSKEKKNRRSMFKIEIKMNCLSPKNQDDALFKNRSKKPACVLSPLNTMPSFD